MTGARQTTDRTQRVSLVVEVFVLRAGVAATEEFVQRLFDVKARRLGAVVGADNDTVVDVPPEEADDYMAAPQPKAGA